MSLQLSAQARTPEGQEMMIQNINHSLQSRYPTATLDTEGGQ
jgi:hypothetical protein